MTIAGTAFSSDCRSGIAVEPGTEAVPGLAVVRNVDGDRSYFHRDIEGCPEAATCRRKSFVVPGDRVIVMLPRIPECYDVLLGCFKLNAIPMPGTTQLTSRDIEYRVNKAEAEVR